jgi:predicted methyltransferase
MKLHHLVVLAAVCAAVPFVPAGAATDGKGQQAAADPALQAAVNGAWRTEKDKARDATRHPAESLAFWGLKPGMTILEVQPGGGWWTEILAPYAKLTGGRFHATAADIANPELPEASRKARADFEARWAAKPDLYGTVGYVNWGAKSAPLPADTFDFILTSRSIHGWMGAPDMVEKTFREFHAAWHPGGRTASRQPGSAGPQGDERLRHRGVRDRAGREGRLHARRALRDQREREGYEGPPVRRVDVAADAALERVRLRQAGRPEL